MFNIHIIFKKNLLFKKKTKFKFTRILVHQKETTRATFVTIFLSHISQILQHSIHILSEEIHIIEIGIHHQVIIFAEK